MFAIVVLTVWSALHAYVGWRVLMTSSLSDGWRWGAWGLLGANLVLVPATFILRRQLGDSAFPDALQWIAYVAIGVIVLMFFLTVIRDLALLVWDGAQRIAVEAGAEDGGPVEPERRQFLMDVLNVSVTGAAVAGMFHGYREATSIPEVAEVEVPVEDLPEALDGFRICQISDLHIGGPSNRAFLQGVVDRIGELAPDMIAVTGDLIDGYVPELSDEVAPLDQLSAPHGCYFVTGNHEYYWDAPGWCAEAQRRGLEVLVNEHRVIERDGARLVVGGVTDYRAERHIEEHASDPHAALDGAPEADFRLLLAHQPKSVYEASRAGFDLQLSGHTHGGQFWPWNLFVGLAHPFVAGLHDFERMRIYVSRGTGFWGPPMRIGAPSEITLLRLRKA